MIAFKDGDRKMCIKDENKFDFDRIIDRINTSSIKWDLLENIYGEKDLLPLWVADMDFPSPKEVTAAITERAKHPIYGYTAISDDYYNAIISWNKRRYGYEIEKDWIFHSPGVVPAINWLIQCLTEKGDKIIIQEPVYHPFKHGIEINERIPVINELSFKDDSYEMNLEELQGLIDDKTKVLILCNPHNPVGRVWSKSELIALGELCLKHGIIVIADEIHGDLIYKNYKHIPFASISEEFSDICITCSAPTKTFNLAGLQCSNIIIKNPELRKKLAEYLDKLHLQGPTPLSIVGVQAAYNYGEPWLEALLSYLEDNVKFTMGFIKENLPSVKVIPPQGTYLLWLDFRGTGLNREEINERLLKKAKVALNDGYMFGKLGYGFQRMNIACPKTILKEALTRITLAFQE
ncbi:MalY/PatB family protein [Alloiococcus sp. CFN-8]|uniref:MalY/PatB family protein n=1 Tax=Alloiococcus sp. CFN-8 TaxID=3416081 RepID=UPI003CF7ABF2